MYSRIWCSTLVVLTVVVWSWVVSCVHTMHTAHIWHNQSGRFVQYIPKEIPCYSFLLEADWIPRLLIADRRKSSLENFQDPTRNRNPEPLILWSSVSITCTARPEGGNYNLLWDDVYEGIYHPRHFCGHLDCQNLSEEGNVQKIWITFHLPH